MTGMEHAIEQAAKVVGDLPGFTDKQVRRIAEDLADAGLLAPAPLREEWGTRFSSNEYVHHGAGVEYPFFFKGDPPKGINVRRYVTDWEPTGNDKEAGQ